MKSFSVSTTIRAAPESVWAILTDGTKWTTWNTTIEQLEGSIASGSKLRVFPRLSPGRTFPVRVTEFTPPQRVIWTGGMPLGLFKGVRTYTIGPTDGGVEFTMEAVFQVFWPR